jgi:hypothetical protein
MDGLVVEAVELVEQRGPMGHRRVDVTQETAGEYRRNCHD